MKCTRKLASLLLALVTVFALALTAFATEPGTTTTTGTITVANPLKARPIPPTRFLMSSTMGTVTILTPST